VPVKLRHPWGVFVLALVTLGIYYLVWYFKINKELNRYGLELQSPNPLAVTPGVAVLAISLGGLIIVPPFVSMWNTFARIGRAEELAGVQDRINHGLGFVLYLLAVIFLPFELVYAQSHLNRLWRHEAAEAQARLSGLRGEPGLVA
jgi:uncharacterized protein DUF4234